MSKIREEDDKKEKALHQALEKHFYPNTLNYESITNPNEQFKGLDATFQLPNPETNETFTYLCDEKGALDYVGRDLYTFFLEISFINKDGDGKVQDGWLVEDGKETNSFLFVWIPNNNVEYALVKKEKIIQHLKSLGWTIDKLKRKSEKIRLNPNEEPLGNLRKNGCKFSIAYKKENSIGVLLPKPLLMEMADYKGKFSTDIIDPEISSILGIKKIA